MPSPKLHYLQLIFLIIISYTLSLKTSELAIADPFIYYSKQKDTYYAYGTTNANEGFECYSSKDLKTWKYEKFVLKKGNDIWGNKDFWAPEVYHVNGKYIMYYSAEERMCAAISNNPLGPFKQKEKKQCYQ